MNEKLHALIEGGLSQTRKFTPHPLSNHLAWLKWRLEVAQIPIKRLMQVQGSDTFILHAGCCIATLRERAHNSGLKFKKITPHFGTSLACVVEFVANTEEG